MSDRYHYNVIRIPPQGRDISVSFDRPFMFALTDVILNSSSYPDCAYEIRRLYTHAGTFKIYEFTANWLKEGGKVYDCIEHAEVDIRDFPAYHDKVHSTI